MARNRTAERIATVFGIGRAPAAPGTVASAAAMVPGWLLVLLGWPWLLFFAVAAAWLGVWACGTYADETGADDPSECVADEVAGQWFALMPLAIFDTPYRWWALLAAFALFRLLDVTKPWPISTLEEWPDGLGIMADDVAAGIVAAVLLTAAMLLGWL